MQLNPLFAQHLKVESQSQFDLESLVTAFEENDEEGIIEGWKKFRDSFKDTFRNFNKSFDDYEGRIKKAKFVKELKKFNCFRNADKKIGKDVHLEVLKEMEKTGQELNNYLKLTLAAVTKYNSESSPYSDIDAIADSPLLKGDGVMVLPTLHLSTIVYSTKDKRNGNNMETWEAEAYEPLGSFSNSWTSDKTVTDTFDEAFFDTYKKAMLDSVASHRKVIDTLYNILEISPDLGGYEELPTGGAVTALTQNCQNIMLAIEKLYRTAAADLERFS